MKSLLWWCRTLWLGKPGLESKLSDMWSLDGCVFRQSPNSIWFRSISNSRIHIVHTNNWLIFMINLLFLNVTILFSYLLRIYRFYAIQVLYSLCPLPFWDLRITCFKLVSNYFSRIPYSQTTLSKNIRIRLINISLSEMERVKGDARGRHKPHFSLIFFLVQNYSS